MGEQHDQPADSSQEPKKRKQAIRETFSPRGGSVYLPDGRIIECDILWDDEIDGPRPEHEQGEGDPPAAPPTGG